MAGFSHISMILVTWIAEFVESLVIRWAVKPIGYSHSTCIIELSECENSLPENA